MNDVVVIGSDESHPVFDTIAEELEAHGHRVERMPIGVWGPCARAVAERVARGDAAFGVVCCWTGTGVSIAANKVSGVRAALCVDAATAEGARRWNDANVLAISLRLTSAAVAKEIVAAWVRAPYGGSEGESLRCLAELDAGA